jgi:hypothetical protein
MSLPLPFFLLPPRAIRDSDQSQSKGGGIALALLHNGAREDFKKYS